MPLIQTRGSSSISGYGGTSVQASTPIYIEDVFSTYLYTGNGTTQTINNGIDLSTKGGLVWQKRRDSTGNHSLTTSTGLPDGYGLRSNTTDAQVLDYSSYPFTSTGFTTVYNATFSPGSNISGATYTSWTFRKQPKFFDVVTWTGNGVNNRWIDHSLASTPGAIIIKRTDTNSNWFFYHRSLFGYGLLLNSTSAETSAISDNGFVSSTSATQFRVTDGGVSMSTVNANGGTYVAYLFAHNAGGFGLTGTDNVISCGSYTGNGSTTGPEINLGYEPQYVLIKNASAVGYWFTFDNMRGIATGGTDALLWPNVSDAEANSTDNIDLTATGFKIKNSAGSINGSGNTLIYIAIRRGPMKTPTSGTSVYEGTAYTGNGALNRKIGSSVLTDWLLLASRDATAQLWSTYGQIFFDRLRGQNVSLSTTTNNVETTSWSTYFNLDMNAGWDTGDTGSQEFFNKSGSTYVSHAFRRAPGFFDVVCYTGTGSATTVSHNLGVAPELMIVKSRSSSGYDWRVYSATLGATRYILLNAALSFSTSSDSWNDTAPTASVFTVGSSAVVNGSGATHVAYLFATCPGVSKVGSYTGTGALQTVNCGFTGGARFVLIKRTNLTGDWYVWDTARGIIAGNDPYLSLNSPAAEVTNTDYIDPVASGFELSSTAPAAINANGGTYIYLAIA